MWPILCLFCNSHYLYSCTLDRCSRHLWDCFPCSFFFFILFLRQDNLNRHNFKSLIFIFIFPASIYYFAPPGDFFHFSYYTIRHQNFYLAHFCNLYLLINPIILWQIDGEKWKQWQTLFSQAPKSLWIVITAMKVKDTCSLEESYDKPKCHIKK